MLRVEPDPAQRDSSAYQQSIGNDQLSSESDAMRLLNPRVYELIADIATEVTAGAASRRRRRL